jgi:hypothetical protein
MASIKGSAQVETTEAITVEAISLGHTDADGTGVNVGAAGVGLSPAFAEITTAVNAFAGGTGERRRGDDPDPPGTSQHRRERRRRGRQEGVAVVLVGSGGHRGRRRVGRRRRRDRCR